MSASGVSCIIPRRTPSLNEWTPGPDQHELMRRRKYLGIKDYWMKQLLARIGRKYPEETGQSLVTINCQRSRLLDKDNFHGGCKPIVDCLKKLGWIRDDKPNDIHVIYKQKTGMKGAGRTIIHIEPTVLQLNQDIQHDKVADLAKQLVHAHNTNKHVASQHLRQTKPIIEEMERILNHG